MRQVPLSSRNDPLTFAKVTSLPMGNPFPQRIYAVLTGDLVDSTRLGNAKTRCIQDTLKRLAREFAAIHPAAVLAGLDIFRGDSWQLCLHEPEWALDAAVFIRTGLKAESLTFDHPVDTRIGIALGPAEDIVVGRVSESTGAVFADSGAALDALTSSDRRMNLALPGDDHTSTCFASLFVSMLDLQIQQWTPREAVAVFGVLSNLTQVQIAAMPIAASSGGRAPQQQTIADALKRAAWRSHVEPALTDARACLRFLVRLTSH